MNQNNNLLGDLATLTKQLSNSLSGGKNKPSKLKKRPNKQGVRRLNRGISQNPAQRAFPDTSLSLTRDQFTATSPQNYWETVRASTPGGMRIRARELIGSVAFTSTGTGAYQIMTLGSAQGARPFIDLNPLSFPRLSNIAPAFEMFIFHKANILFQSNQPTTATGEVLGCVDYDANDNAPTSSSLLMRNVSASMANIYSDASFQALKSLSRLPKYFVATDSSAQFNQTRQGMIYVASEGVTGTPALGTSIGYIVIEYDIEFFTPQ